VGEPGAVGGVVYRPFPDPRLVGNSEPLPADRGSLHIPRPAGRTDVPDSSVARPDPAVVAPSAPGGPAVVAVEPASTGRHTVPDELVQGATYRLPPDRIFRAKVPDAANGPGLPDEPTTRLSVPRPRQS
jgi:hypothetical protein